MKAALLIFEEKGFKESTISQIADQAGLHVQTFYRHFKSKDDLITEMWRQR
jgi:AcrR family transcriptional regulator